MVTTPADELASIYTGCCGCCLRRGVPLTVSDVAGVPLCRDCAGDGCRLHPRARGFSTEPHCGSRASDYFLWLMEA